MLQPIQIIMAIVAIYGIVRAVFNFHKRKLSPKGFLFWIIVWVAVGIIAFVPGIINLLSKPVGVGRGVDFLVYISIIVLFYLVFKAFVKIESVEQDITELVRKISLEKTSKKRKAK